MRIVLIVSLLILGVSSCNKEKIGCLDQAALNFDEDANTESGYCDYPDTLIAWFSINRTNIAKSQDTSITHFKVYFYENYYGDGVAQFIGQRSIEDYWVEKPLYTDADAFTLVITNLYEIDYSARWVLTDQNDNEINYSDIADISEDGAYYTEL